MKNIVAGHKKSPYGNDVGGRSMKSCGFYHRISESQYGRERIFWAGGNAEN